MTHTDNPNRPPLDLLPGRRTFFGWLTYGTSALAAGVLGIPLVQYFLGTMPTRESWVPLGPVDSFALDETRMITFENPIRQPWDGKTAHTGVFVRNQGPDRPAEERFLILAVNCAHLGCPVTWFPQSGLFMCPCHGGVYYATGARASGPPTRGLFRCVWRINKGQLEVQAPRFPSLQAPLDPTNVAMNGSGQPRGCDHA